MAKKYARGEDAWGECGRCAGKFLLRTLVFDGYYPNMRVCPSCYEGKHPQENLKRIDDPVALWRPAPELLNPPTAPVLAGRLLSILSVRLTWSESQSDVSQVDLYRIYRSVDSGPFELLTLFDVERDMFGARTNALQFDDDIEFAVHQYRYYVIAHAVQGGDSAPSNILDLSTVHASETLVYVASDIWVKPADAVFIEVEILGSGGGAGSGRTEQQGVGGGQGGFGGGGGGRSTFTYLASELTDTVAILVDQGGLGAEGVTAIDSTTNGAQGVSGGITAFGPYLMAGGGVGGVGGQSSGGAQTTGGTGLDSDGGLGGIGNANASQQGPPGVPRYGGGGGGSGGGTGSAQGLNGGASFTFAPGPFVAGTGGGIDASGGAGTQAIEGLPGTGGGGGGQNAGGGRGGVSGGGGGGGSRVGNGTSGPGGPGGTGQIVVTSYF